MFDFSFFFFFLFGSSVCFCFCFFPLSPPLLLFMKLENLKDCCVFVNNKTVVHSVLVNVRTATPGARLAEDVVCF